MPVLRTEYFRCTKCGEKRKIASLGHAITVPCPRCGSPMKQVKKAAKQGRA